LNQIDINSEEYPYRLKQIKDAPEVLYYRGEWDPGIFRETLSVVGSRKMTRYGEQITNLLISDIAGQGITIVSGFMYGIDAVAHGAALNASGRTIAVMPCGIDRVHPEYQLDLHKNIKKANGLILSEYPGEKAPALWTYPRRNRIIAGLSPILLVVEAGLKSGALITAKIARKYSKKIYAVPGPLTSSVSSGTSLLIKEGAMIVTESNDILAEYGKQIKKNDSNKRQRSDLSKIQRRIIELISFESMGIDEIIRSLQKPTSVIGAELTILCIKKIISLDDGRYSLAEEAHQGSRKC